MKNTEDVREALLEMANLLANIAQSKLAATPGTGTVESLVSVTRASGFAESAALLRSIGDAMESSNDIPLPEDKKPAAKLFVM